MRCLKLETICGDLQEAAGDIFVGYIAKMTYATKDERSAAEL